MVSKAILYAFLFILCLSGCVDRKIKEVELMNENLYDMPGGCDFSKVRSGYIGENECTPKLLDPFFSEFSGILINGPERVVWPKKDSPGDYFPGPFGETDGPFRLMIAGLVRAKYNTQGLNGNFGEEVVVVAVDQSSAEAFSGRMAQPDFIEPEPSEFGDSDFDEETSNALVSSWFNLDLVHDLNLPISNAVYSIYATFGEYKSNVLTVHTVVE